MIELAKIIIAGPQVSFCFELLRIYNPLEICKCHGTTQIITLIHVCGQSPQKITFESKTKNTNNVISFV